MLKHSKVISVIKQGVSNNNTSTKLFVIFMITSPAVDNDSPVDVHRFFENVR